MAQLRRHNVILISYETIRQGELDKRRYRNLVAKPLAHKVAAASIKRAESAFLLDLLENDMSEMVSTMIIDEAHAIESIESLTCWSIKTIAANASFVSLMSGTLMSNKWYDLYAVCSFTKNSAFKDLDMFCNMFGNMEAPNAHPDVFDFLS